MLYGRAFFQIWFTFASMLLGLAFTSVAWSQSPGPLQGKFFGNAAGGVLFVALHGDLSSGANAEYQYGIARRVASSDRNVLAFGLIRPGYRDESGLKSPGTNHNRRDQYTARNNALVAQTIANLRKATRARAVVVLGHSGGAIQLATILGRYPGLIDAAVLVSCPCDLRRWRASTGNPSLGRSQSPARFISKVTRSTRVIAITGSNDTNTRPAFARDYVSDLVARGVPAQFVEVPGAGHNYGALRRSSEAAALQLIRRYQ